MLLSWLHSCWLRMVGLRLVRPAPGAGRRQASRSPPGRKRSDAAQWPSAQRAVFEALEPRLLHSADTPLAFLLQAPVMMVESSQPTTPVPSAPAAATAVAAVAASSPRLEMVFVDTQVQGHQALLDALLRDADNSRQLQVVLLDASRDGISQISAALQHQQQGVAALHVVSHGTAGTLQLGGAWLDDAALASRADEIRSWGQALTADADLLLYGCDVAQGVQGQAFVARLSALTGADVAASNNRTASTDSGGDWTLEVNAGPIETAPALSAAAQDAFIGALDITTGLVGRWAFDSNANDFSGNGYNGTLNNGAAIDTNGGTRKIGDGKLALDGSNDFVDLSPHKAAATGLNAGTVSAWIKTSGASGQILIATNIADADSSASFRVSSGKLTWDVWDNDSEKLTVRSVVSINDNAWHHVVATVDGVGNKLYIDGVQVAVTYGVGNASTQKFFSDVGGIDKFLIGRDENNSGPRFSFDGLIDEVRVYSRALSGADVSELYAYTAAGISVAPTTGLVTTEAGATASFTVVLDSAPSAAVNIPVSSSNVREGTVSTASLVFNPANWNVPQTVTVTGVNDTLDDGNRAYSVVLGAASSSDADYSGIDPDDVAASNTDNDTQNTVLVTTANDLADGDTSSLVALLDNPGVDGQVSLREAITAANNTANGSGGADRIHFNIAGTGVHTINVGSALPTITGAVIIDASTDDSFAANSNRPAIILDGNNAFAGDGLVLSAAAGGSTIRGLVVRDFSGDGIEIQAGSSGHTIVGNYLGSFDTTGAAAAGEGNTGAGVLVLGGGNTIGGTTTADRNLMGGNAYGVQVTGASATNNVVSGNYMGTNAAGTSAVANSLHGIHVASSASGTTIGGSAAGAGNVTSGNTNAGLYLASGSVTVYGNLIGTNAAGTAALGNGNDGISISSGSNIVIGGPAAGQGNLISGNTGGEGIWNGSAGTNVVIQGNAIGSNLAQTAAIGNSGRGIKQDGTGTLNTIGGTVAGQGNLIWGNFMGVQVTAGQVAILGNTIRSNTNLGLDLGTVGVTANDVGDADSGANNLQNFPVLTSARTDASNQLVISGSFNSTANSYYRIEFFASTSADGSGYGEGQIYLGYADVATDGAGLAALSTTLSVNVAAGAFISATATRSDPTFSSFSDTSEFAQNITASMVPVVTLSPGTLAYTENDAATPLDGALTVSAPGSLNLVNATVSISGNFAAGQDLLAFSDQLGITGSWNAGTGVLTLSGTSSVANYQTALRSVNYSNGSELPSTQARTVSVVVHDGTDPSVAVARGLTVLAVNDAPTATNLGAAESYVEDTVLNLTDIVASDVDSANITATLTLSNPAAGSLNTGAAGAVTSAYNAGTGAWTASGALGDVNLLLAGLNFTPALNFNGAFNIATSISDGVAAPVTGSKAFSGTSVNDAPSATNLSAAEIYTEDLPLNLVDILVSDVDSASVSATFTLSDVAAGALSTGTSGTVTSSYGSGTGVWTASGARADVNALLAGLVFTPATNFTGAFAVSTSVSDGVAAPLTGNKAFVANLVNDAPTATNLAAAETYIEDTPLNLTDIVVSDVDSASVTAMLTLSNPAAGGLSTGTSGAVTATYNAATGLWTASGLIADVNALLASLVFTPTPDFNADVSIASNIDDGSAAPVTGSKSLTGTPLNDAPTATNLNAAETYVEDQPLDLTDIVISDIDSANVTATLTLSNPAAGALSIGTAGAVSASYNPVTGVWQASGARADVNSLLANLAFVPAADFNGSFTLTTKVDDTVAAALLGSKTFVGVAVNDAPTASNLSSAEVYTEDTALDLADIVISDVDHTTGSATLTLSNPAAGVLSTGNSGAVSASYNAATGVWTSSGALVDVNALLAAVNFMPALDGLGSFSISTRISDGMAAPVTGVKLFTALAVNDAPTTTNLSAAETYVEDLPLDLTDIVISDRDSANVTATLTLSDAAAGVLGSGTSGAITSSFNGITGVWSASGALADVNALLAALVFQPAPDHNASFNITTRIDDGAAAVTGLKVMTGVAVNDAPTASGLQAAEVYTEDTVLDLSDLVISDIDSTALTATLTLSDAAVGALSTSTAGSVTAGFDALTGVWSASGPRSDVNAVLAAVRFTPALNFNSSFSIATAVSDGVAAAIGGTKTFSGVAVNDAPVLATGGGLLVAEGSLTALGAAQLQATDVDHSAAQLAYTVLSAPAHGTLLRDGVALAAGASFTQAELDAGRVAYRHDGSETTSDRWDYSLDDGLVVGANGSMPITVTPVNDEGPLISSPGAGVVLAVPENTQAVTRVLASDADLPAQALHYEIAGGVDAVFFSIDGNTGELQFVAPADFERPLDSDADNVYHFDLRVSDGLLSSIRPVVVTVLPDQDNAPMITSSGGGAQAGVQLQEGVAAVVTLTATDADRPPQTLTYAIVGGADAARFVINAASGVLRFVEAPLAIAPQDSDRNNLYDVVVQASDGTRVGQQALRVQVRATLATALPTSPPTAEPTVAPKPYTGDNVAPESAPPPALVWPELQPASLPVAEELTVWTSAGQGRRSAFIRLGDNAGSRNFDLVAESATFQLAGAEGAGGPGGQGINGELPAPGQDTPSLEAALGLPTVDPGLLQSRPGGLSLAALAAQTAARSSTSVPGQLLPAQPLGEGEGSGDDSGSVIEALAAPVVAGGMAFSATLLVWATRAGGLVAAMMASVPAWRSLDPLPILERADKPAADEEGDGLPGATGAAPEPAPDVSTETAAGDDPLVSMQRQAPLRVLIEPLEMLR